MIIPDLQQTTKKWMILPDLWDMLYIIPLRNEWSYLIYGTWSTTDHQEMNDPTWSMASEKDTGDSRQRAQRPAGEML